MRVLCSALPVWRVLRGPEHHVPAARPLCSQNRALTPDGVIGRPEGDILSEWSGKTGWISSLKKGSYETLLPVPHSVRLTGL